VGPDTQEPERHRPGGGENGPNAHSGLQPKCGLSADGGAGGSGGGAGHGVGGGVYNLGMFDFDAATIIKKNHASTSNDDRFP
jgi:hypothetical protein